ncbi:Alkylated DNA repair protein ALKBH6-like protein [Drosera capensis]
MDFSLSIALWYVVPNSRYVRVDRVFEMVADESLRNVTVGSVPTVIYIPDFVTDAEEAQLMNHIYQAPISKWKILKNRRLQNWGNMKDATDVKKHVVSSVLIITSAFFYADDKPFVLVLVCVAGGVVHEKGLLGQKLPPWLTKITQRIFVGSKIFPSEPNHVLINEYLPDQGIMPHQDGPAYFPAAAILSLGSPAVMDFTPHSKLKDCVHASQRTLGHDACDGHSEGCHDQNSFSLLLMPRSLLIFKDLVYSDYLHGIEGSTLQYCDRAVNLAESLKAHGNDKLMPDLVETVVEGSSRQFKVVRRTGKRISLTCRFVPKVKGRKSIGGGRDIVTMSDPNSYAS